MTQGAGCLKSENMTLSEYMKAKKMSDADIAPLVGKDQSVIGRYRRGDIRPDLYTVAKISEITKGKVRFQDWLPNE